MKQNPKKSDESSTPRKRTRITKAAFDEMKAKLDEAQYRLLMERGQAGSDAINRETTIRGLGVQIGELKSRLEMEKRRSSAYAFAFGEFRCRELLWIASQWVRTAKFDLTINGHSVKRSDLISEIDTFLKSFTFKSK